MTFATTQEAYDSLVPVPGKFDGLGVVPYTLAILAAQLQRMELAYAWLAKAYATPEGRELRLLSLEEKELDGRLGRFEASLVSRKAGGFLFAA